jgi:hypothetical protein
MHTIVNSWLDCAYVVKNLPQYCNTFLGSAQIILFSFFAKIFTKKNNECWKFRKFNQGYQIWTHEWSMETFHQSNQKQKKERKENVNNIIEFIPYLLNFQNQKLKRQIRIFKLYYLFSTLMLNLKRYYGTYLILVRPTYKH